MLRKYLERIEEGDTRPIKDEHACPQCGYLQSWIANRYKRSFSSIVVSGCLLALCLSQTIFMIRIHEQLGTLFYGGASLMLAGILVWAVRRYI